MKESVYSVSALFFIKLCEWFSQQRRSFPWREEKTPYKVFVSEMMLQQTQADRVAGYFDSFLRQFPTIEALAEADDMALLKAWEGLGYYSRVRQMKAAARQIVLRHDGIFPEEKELLLALPGIGAYTAGAILSFAYEKRAEAVDANVRRVMNRVWKGFFEKQSQGLVEAILPEKNPHIAMEALIELGALVCKKKPLCEKCPVKGHCYGYNCGKIESLTVSKKKLQKFLWRNVFLVCTAGKVLIKKPSENGIMAGLYEFYYQETGLERISVHSVCTMFSVDSGAVKMLPKVRQSFTNHTVVLYPYLIAVDVVSFIPEGCFYVSVDDIESLPFSSGHKKIIPHIFSFNS